MTTSAAPAIAARLDARLIAPQERTPSIFSAFRGLRRRETLEFALDHDPTALYNQFRIELGGAFVWTCVESGPETWCVQITKLGDPVGDGRCCGRCGGD